METKIKLTPRKEKIITLLILLILIGIFIGSFLLLDLDITRFIERLGNFPRVFRLFLSPNLEMLRTGMEQLLISIILGICGLVIGGLISLILSFLAADNLAVSRSLSLAIKGAVSLIRAIPNLVLILMIVASLGMGYSAGVVGLTLSSIGFLTRAFIGTIEDQDNAIIETLQATGATKLQIIIHGFLPNVLPNFLVWISIRMEASIAESISLGMIGIGGIGMLLNRAIRQHNHSTVSIMILIIFISMYLVEIVLNRIKRKAQA